MKATKFTALDVQKISTLAHIPITNEEAETLATGFTKTMKVVDKLQDIDVTGVIPTSQVTGLENVFREDHINTENMLSQEQALANGKRTYNGFFVVDQILDE